MSSRLAGGKGRRLAVADAWVERLDAMGVRARVMPPGRCALATLELSKRPFPALERSVRIERVMFSTVGRDAIKCLKPLSLFALPLIDVRECESAADIEERIRASWRERIEALGPAWEGLRALAARCLARDPDSVLQLPLDGEPADVRASMVVPGEVILPGRGPLGGIPLERSQRLLAMRELPETQIEVQIAIQNRLEELAEDEARREQTQRKAVIEAGAVHAPTIGVRSHTVLLVGMKLAQDRRTIDSLALRGHTIVTARSTTEALRLYQRCSPELVLTDADLGRSEGLELVPMLAAVPGVDCIPVIVVDDVRHEARRRAAREIGAIGYLVRPLDIARIAPRVGELVEAPARRRFTRYAHAVAVEIAGTRRPSTATALSRGGLYVATDADLPAHSVHRCELVVAGCDRALPVEVEVRYRLGPGGGTHRGLGLRFERFGAGGESSYLELISGLSARAGGETS